MEDSPNLCVKSKRLEKYVGRYVDKHFDIIVPMKGIPPDFANGLAAGLVLAAGGLTAQVFLLVFEPVAIGLYHGFRSQESEAAGEEGPEPSHNRGPVSHNFLGVAGLSVPSSEPRVDLQQLLQHGDRTSGPSAQDGAQDALLLTRTREEGHWRKFRNQMAWMSENAIPNNFWEIADQKLILVLDTSVDRDLFREHVGSMSRSVFTDREEASLESVFDKNQNGEDNAEGAWITHLTDVRAFRTEEFNGALGSSTSFRGQDPAQQTMSCCTSACTSVQHLCDDLKRALEFGGGSKRLKITAPGQGPFSPGFLLHPVDWIAELDARSAGVLQRTWLDRESSTAYASVRPQFRVPKRAAEMFQSRIEAIVQYANEFSQHEALPLQDGQVVYLADLGEFAQVLIRSSAGGPVVSASDGSGTGPLLQTATRPQAPTSKDQFGFRLLRDNAFSKQQQEFLPLAELYAGSLARTANRERVHRNLFEGGSTASAGTASAGTGAGEQEILFGTYAELELAFSGKMYAGDAALRGDVALRGGGVYEETDGCLESKQPSSTSIHTLDYSINLVRS